MTLYDLIEHLESIKKYETSNKEVQIFDSDSKSWKTVTYIAHGGCDPIRLYSDDP